MISDITLQLSSPEAIDRLRAVAEALFDLQGPGALTGPTGSFLLRRAELLGVHREDALQMVGNWVRDLTGGQ